MTANSQKSVLVTGASRGIGAALATRLAADGYAVAVNYAGNAQAAQKVVESIASSGGVAISVQGDVSSATDVSHIFDEAEKAFGRIDGVVNNAGVMVNQTIADGDEATYERIFNINVRGVFLILREAAKRVRDGGRIVNFSSSVVGLSLPTYGLYSASKAAVDALTRILSKELRGRDITVNSIAPGPTATELFLDGKTPEQIEHLAQLNPLGRIASPDDIANTVSFLMSPQGGWINGQVIRANGGMI